MPWYFPVCIRDFVEENTPHRKELRSQNRFDQSADGGRMRYVPDFRGYVQEVSNREDATALSNRPILPDFFERKQQLRNLIQRKDALSNSKSIRIHFSFDISLVHV